MNTLSNRRYLITHGTMQSLCLDNNERKKTMNSYFTNTANRNIVQSPKFRACCEMVLKISRGIDMDVIIYIDKEYIP